MLDYAKKDMARLVAVEWLYIFCADMVDRSTMMETDSKAEIISSDSDFQTTTAMVPGRIS